MNKCSKVEAAEMVSTKDLLDLMKEKLGSDYKTAKALGVTTQRIYKMRYMGGILTDEQGLKVAEILEFPQEFIILSLAAERSFNSPAYKVLADITDKFDPRKAGAFCLCTLIALGMIGDGFLTKLAILAV